MDEESNQAVEKGSERRGISLIEMEYSVSDFVSQRKGRERRRRECEIPAFASFEAFWNELFSQVLEKGKKPWPMIRTFFIRNNILLVFWFLLLFLLVF